MAFDLHWQRNTYVNLPISFHPCQYFHACSDKMRMVSHMFLCAFHSTKATTETVVYGQTFKKKHSRERKSCGDAWLGGRAMTSIQLLLSCLPRPRPPHSSCSHGTLFCLLLPMPFTFLRHARPCFGL